MTKAILRENILRNNGYPESFHFCIGKDDYSEKFWKQSFECWIPETANGLNLGNEYNMILATKKGFVLVNSLDFDFEEENIEP
jgi:hypothetical protein